MLTESKAVAALTTARRKAGIHYRNPHASSTALFRESWSSPKSPSARWADFP